VRPRTRLALHLTVVFLTFAIGCLAKYFWDLNYRDVSPGGCVLVHTQNVTHLAIGAPSLLISMFFLAVIVRSDY
jgi:hypothetical protein